MQQLIKGLEKCVGLATNNPLMESPLQTEMRALTTRRNHPSISTLWTVLYTILPRIQLHHRHPS